MAKQIPGVPEKFTRAEYTALFEACGVSPELFTEMRFTSYGVRATVLALDENGARILGPEGYEKHDIFIPVDRE